jgi:hypothetical protein
VTPTALHGNLGITSLNNELSEGQGLVCEMVFTFILVMSIFGTTDPNRALFGSPALGIGFTVGVVHLAAVSLFLLCKSKINFKLSTVSKLHYRNKDLHWQNDYLKHQKRSL